MNILEFEKLLLKDKNIEENFINFLEEDFEKNGEIDFFQKNREYKSESFEEEYFDDFLLATFENLYHEEDCECCHHHEEDIITENMKDVYKLALFMLRENINYLDLVQEGMMGLIEAKENSGDDRQKFNKVKDYFIIKKMVSYIQNYLEYREIAFKEYIKREKSKCKHENNEEFLKEIKNLEKTVDKKFKYQNLKYILSLEELEIIFLYYGFDGKGKKNFTDLVKYTNKSLEEVTDVLKNSMCKLSMLEEKVEI